MVQENRTNYKIRIIAKYQHLSLIGTSLFKYRPAYISNIEYRPGYKKSKLATVLLSPQFNFYQCLLLINSIQNIYIFGACSNHGKLSQKENFNLYIIGHCILYLISKFRFFRKSAISLVLLITLGRNINLFFYLNNICFSFN